MTPGSVECRFKWLLEELEKRFPSTMEEMLSSSVAPEMLYVKKLDAYMKENKVVDNS